MSGPVSGGRSFARRRLVALGFGLVQFVSTFSETELRGNIDLLHRIQERVG
jgi:hypothetical protein